MEDQHWSARGLRCYRAAPIHRFDQHCHLRWRQCHRAIDDRRPHEASLLQSLGEQPQPGAIPIDRLEVIAPLAAENEQTAVERILSDHLLDLCGKAIEPGPQIDGTTGQEHLRPRCQVDHVALFIARRTRDSAFSFTKASTLTRAPFGSTISIPPTPPPLLR